MTACPVCGSCNNKAVAPFRFNNPVFTGCSRAVCADCGMVFASPMPSDAALSAYNASYFSTSHGGQPTSPLVIAFFFGVARLRLAFVKRFLRKQKIAVHRVLELGPGPGFFPVWLCGLLALLGTVLFAQATFGPPEKRPADFFAERAGYADIGASLAAVLAAGALGGAWRS